MRSPLSGGGSPAALAMSGPGLRREIETLGRQSSGGAGGRSGDILVVYHISYWSGDILAV